MPLFEAVEQFNPRTSRWRRPGLSDLSRCAWETLKEFFQEVVPEEDACLRATHRQAVPGAVIAIHSFGDFLGWHPHLHVLCTDGCFYGQGMFHVAPFFELKHLEEIFRHKVFKMLLSKGKITEDRVDMLMNWRHSGFNVFCGSRNRGPTRKGGD